MSKKHRQPKQSGDWWQIRAKGTASTEILIYGDIGDSWDDESITAADFVKAISALDASEISLRINSHGGSVSDGIAIHNAIVRHHAHVIAHIDGVAASMASAIAMAADEVVMPENAMLMLHAPWGATIGNAKDHREMAETLDKFAESLTSVYAARNDVSPDWVRDLLADGDDHWFSAQEAFEAGLIDTVNDAVKIAAQLNLSRYRDIPAAAAAFQPEANIMPTKTDGGQPAKDLAQKKMDTKQVEHISPEDVAAKVTAAIAEAQAKEQTRRQTVREVFARHQSLLGMPELTEACVDDIGCDVARARELALDLMGEGMESLVPGNADAVVTSHVDARDKFRAGASHALLARAGIESDDGANEYRGLRLVDMAREALVLANVPTRGKTGMDIVGAAFTQSTSDFPVLLENTMHKSLLAAYERAANVWRQIARAGSVSDFRAHPRLRLGGFSTLDTVAENGEFKYQGIPDARKESVTATTKGNLINLSRQMVINDDLDGFMQLTAMLGGAAARSVEADLFALLAANPTMSDAVTLIHASHGNTTTGVITAATVGAARVLMRKQAVVGTTDDYLNIQPTVLLCAEEKRDTASVLMSAEFNPASSNSRVPNPVRSAATVVSSPRVADPKWYLFADPSIAPALEVAFLDGNQTPFLDRQDGFTVDGSMYKVRLDYGVAALDWQPIVYSTGS